MSWLSACSSSHSNNALGSQHWWLFMTTCDATSDYKVAIVHIYDNSKSRCYCNVHTGLLCLLGCNYNFCGIVCSVKSHPSWLLPIGTGAIAEWINRKGYGWNRNKQVQKCPNLLGRTVNVTKCAHCTPPFPLVKGLQKYHYHLQYHQPQKSNRLSTKLSIVTELPTEI